MTLVSYDVAPMRALVAASTARRRFAGKAHAGVRAVGAAPLGRRLLWRRGARDRAAAAREIGIRVALGATPRRIVRFVILPARRRGAPRRVAPGRRASNAEHRSDRRVARRVALDAVLRVGVLSGP